MPITNVHSAPSHNLYSRHENSIPFPHRDLAAAYLTSLSLLNRESTVENVVLYNLSSESYLNDITDDPPALPLPHRYHPASPLPLPHLPAAHVSVPEPHSLFSLLRRLKERPHSLPTFPILTPSGPLMPHDRLWFLLFIVFHIGKL